VKWNIQISGDRGFFTSSSRVGDPRFRNSAFTPCVNMHGVLQFAAEIFRSSRPIVQLAGNKVVCIMFIKFMDYDDDVRMLSPGM